MVDFYHGSLYHSFIDWDRSISSKAFFCGEDSIKNGQVLRERKIHLNFEVIWLFLQQKLPSRKALKRGVHCMTRTRISVSIQDSISVYDTQEVSTFKLWKYLWDKVFHVSSRKLLFWFLAVTFIDGREGGNFCCHIKIYPIPPCKTLSTFIILIIPPSFGGYVQILILKIYAGNYNIILDKNVWH